jgi:hypothetical protein
MAVRYVPKHDFVCADRKGRRRVFRKNNVRRDGSIGYEASELEGLYRDHLGMFEKFEMSGGEIVEQATAAPGEKRARGKKATSSDD